MCYWHYRMKYDMHTPQSKPRNNQPSEQPATHKLCGIEIQQSTTGIDTQQPTGQTKPTEHRQQTTINHPLILRRSHIFSIAVANVSTLQSTSNVSPLTMFLLQILCSSGHTEMSAGRTREDSSLRRLAAAANDCRNRTWLRREKTTILRWQANGWFPFLDLASSNTEEFCRGRRYPMSNKVSLVFWQCEKYNMEIN